MAQRLTQEEAINQLKSLHNDLDFSNSVYVNDRTKIKVICPKHGLFETRPNDLKNNHGCPFCGNERKNRDRTLSQEEFIKRAKIIHGDKYDYSKAKYINGHTKVCIICPKHGEFWQAPIFHLRGQGCKLCSYKKAVGEDSIASLLKENNIEFNQHFRFKECRNKKPLEFDFYLPQNNVCIEYQGIQHYKPIKFFGGEKQFKNQVLNDEIKKQWCSQKDTPNLIIISYKDDIEKILKEEGIINGT